MDRQHFVPQLLLRPFANEQSGKLWVVRKTSPGRRGLSPPSKTAWANSYYTDALGNDFDRDFLQYVESAFGRTANATRITSKSHHMSVCRFVSTLLWRTHLAKEAFYSLTGRQVVLDDLNDKLLLNSVRSHMIQHVQRWIGTEVLLMTLPVESDSDELITSDQPAIPLHIDPRIPATIIVPLTPKQVLVVGPPEVEFLKDTLGTRQINELVLGWAKNEIYSSTLRLARWCNYVLGDEPNWRNPLWTILARKPHFGVRLWASSATAPPSTSYRVAEEGTNRNSLHIHPVRQSSIFGLADVPWSTDR